MVLPNGCSLTRELGITWSRMTAFDQNFLEVYMQLLIRYLRCCGWLSQYTGYTFPDWCANKKASIQNGLIFKGWNAWSDITVLAWDVDLQSPSDAELHLRITETPVLGLLTFWLLLTCQGWRYQLWYDVIMGYNFVYSHYRVVTTCNLTFWSLRFV
jgi:hypothetical protein